MNKKTTIVVAASIALLSVSNWLSFNAGVDLGQDTGVCIAFEIAGVHERMPKDQRDPFCEKADPNKVPFQYTMRRGYLKMIGDEVQ